MRKLFTLALALTAAVSVSADEYYLVGGATDSGWNAGAWNRSAVRAYPAGDGTWTCALKLTNAEGDNGRFKIPNTADGWAGFWAPSQDYMLGTDWVDLSTNSGGDNKYRVAEEGYYLVTLNPTELKIKAEKLTEPAKSGDYYQITSTADYYWFAAYIATDDTKNAKAKLTADLDFDGQVFIPLASDKHKFKGEFDGQEHSIKNATLDCDYSFIGLFAYITDGANIHDIIIDSNCAFTGISKVAGIAGFARDGGTVTLTNLVNNATIKGTGSANVNAAGLVGCSEDGTKIIATNCANTGNVSGANECAAFCGWCQTGTTFTNCWNIGDINGIQSSNQLYRNTAASIVNCFDLTDIGDQGTKLSAATAATGELCFKLNGNQEAINWYQTLPGDELPIPFSSHGQVYANGELQCDGSPVPGGEVTYSNSGSSVVPPHTDSATGYCSVCGTFMPDHLTADAEGYFNIGNAADLNWFSYLVRDYNQAANAKLTADIDLESIETWMPIGQDNRDYKGHFDGQGHRILNLTTDATKDNQGLFGQAVGGAIIENIIIDASCTIKGKAFTAGILGHVYGDGVIVRNCGNEANIVGSAQNSAGIVGCSQNILYISNCYNIGDITGSKENAGICAWMGSNNSTIENCYSIAAIADGNPLWRNNNVVGKNMWNLEGIGTQGTTFTSEQLASGELCYKMNGDQSVINWYQTLGTDAQPMPFSSHSQVYGNGELKCDGTAVEGGVLTYSNTQESIVPDHTDVDGWCSVCGTFMPEHLTADAEGYYNLGTPADLKWFSGLVANTKQDANAKLTADIDLTEMGNGYVPVGTDAAAYKGTFQGEFHTITLNLTDDSKNHQGIFGTVTGGATIFNLTAAGIVKGKEGVGGFAGQATGGGTASFINCGNEAEVTASSKNAGGILGVDMYSGVKIQMINVYSAGAIKGNAENGGLSGWAGDNPSIINVYSISDVENGEAFIRCNGSGGFNNTYGKDQITDQMLASGELCYKLLDGNFRQLIGTDAHPVISNTKPNVSFIGEAGYATLYDTTTGYELNGDVKAYVATLNSTWLDLAEIENVPESTPVVLKGTYFNKTAADLPAINAANDLKGTDAATEADGTMYVLAQKDGKVGFYKAEGTIAAGKAYYQSTSAVKAFYFDSDDATGIDNVDANLNANDAIYNLAGQRIGKMQTGINIVGGKKVILK